MKTPIPPTERNASPGKSTPRVPKGYKQTEVGVIPEDWDVPQLGEILSSRQLGGNYKNSERETSWPLIKMGNLGRGRIKLDKQEFIVPQEVPNDRDRLFEDDVLFNTRNTLDLVGKVAIWRNELPVAYFNSNLMRMKFDRSRVSSYKFINAILNTPQTLSGLRGIAIGTTSVAAIYGRDLVKVRIPLPTLAEQEAIAAALSDADALIDSLEQLIAKKRLLKQGAMQDLLTGHKRLPGFEGEWEVKTIGEVAHTDPENLGAETRPDFEFNYIALEDVDRGTLTGFTTRQFAGAPSRARRKLQPFDVVVSTVRPNLQSHLLFSERHSSWVCSTGFCVVRCRDGVTAPGFIFNLMFSGIVNRQIDALLTGSNYPAINSGDVRGLEIPFPPYAEQTAIAAILSDMDAEIAALEAKLAKARQVKQGMMQELLTGKTRLV